MYVGLELGKIEGLDEGEALREGFDDGATEGIEVVLGI
jgi:hypothetical protein